MSSHAVTRSLRVFIGYDRREREAFEVCVASLRRHASIPLEITRLDAGCLVRAGLFRRDWRMQADGQCIDVLDGKPFSTMFAFTRFLVPALCLWEGWALFCDCDFLWRADVAELSDLAQPHCAVHLVKHDHRPVETTKMTGQLQTRYRRKNWSSLVLWNCGHWANLALTPDRVNTMPGQWLHAFDWLDDRDIGGLDVAWNWLEGVSDPAIEPKAVHMTRGGPWMPEWQDVAYADEWRSYRRC
jgi:hypothetical protein